jgi:hypothetical protein
MKLCPKTLRSVAKELRASAKVQRMIAKRDARLGSYSSAADWAIRVEMLGHWAAHFEGQARAAEGRK